MAHPLLPIVRELSGRLDDLGIPYMLMGGLAVRIWSIPRATYDVDLTVSCNPDRLAEIFRPLEQAGYTIPQPFRSGHIDQLHGMDKVKIQKYVEKKPVDIDLFLVTTEYQREAFTRRRPVSLEELRIWCMSPEDLVLHKLIAGRDRDKADVSDLLLTTRPIDVAYLRRWAVALGVGELLEAKLSEQSDME